MKKYNVKFSFNGTVIVHNADNVPTIDELKKYIEEMLAPFDDTKASITISSLEYESVQ